MTEKFNRNAKVERLTKLVLSYGEEKGLIVKDPYMMFPLVLYPPLFYEVYCYICGRGRVAVARYRMICLVPDRANALRTEVDNVSGFLLFIIHTGIWLHNVYFSRLCISCLTKKFNWAVPLTFLVLIVRNIVIFDFHKSHKPFLVQRGIIETIDPRFYWYQHSYGINTNTKVILKKRIMHMSGSQSGSQSASHSFRIFSYLLWNIELKFCISLFSYEYSINFESRQ